jgi:hypothetical protein
MLTNLDTVVDWEDKKELQSLVQIYPNETKKRLRQLNLKNCHYTVNKGFFQGELIHVESGKMHQVNLDATYYARGESANNLEFVKNILKAFYVHVLEGF